MRLQTFTFVLLCLVVFPYCMRKGNQNPIFPILSDSKLDSPYFYFSYGEDIGNNEYSEERFFDFGDAGFCLFSLPRFLFDRETGVKFKICLPNHPDTKSYWKDAFSILDEISPTGHPREGWGENWHSKHIKFSEWEKEHKGRIPLESYANNLLIDGTVAYSRFDVPDAEFYKWSERECEILFPSRILATTVSQIRFISLEFDCTGLTSFKERILEQNEKWLLVCKPDAPIVSESFRHSDSIYKRYLEWENPSENVICPRYDSFGFEEANVSQKIEIGEKNLENLKVFHRLLLPGGSFIFRDSDTMSGVKLDSNLTEKIGKDGFWSLGNNSSAEVKYIFSQGGEYFSHSRNGASCRNSFNYYITKDSFCGSPGLPNRIASAVLESGYREKSCSVEDIRLTEYFSGTTNHPGLTLGAYLEFTNEGETCDLSSLELVYEGDVFSFQANSKLIFKGEVFLVSRSAWEGWPFLSIVKPFSTKQIRFQIPEIKIIERESQKTKSISGSENHYVLTHIAGLVRRSILADADGRFVPHPDLNSHPYFITKGLYISPGEVVGFDKHDYLPLEISEVLLKGTKDGAGTYSEKFLEWQSPIDRQGFVYFSIESEIKRNFVFWKERDMFFPFVRTGSFICLPLGGFDFPDGILNDQQMMITSLDSGYQTISLENPRLRFNYNPLIYQNSGIDSNFRISIQPEANPFFSSFSKKSNGNCSDFTYASPGAGNRKGIQVAGLEKRISESENILGIDHYLMIPESLLEGTSRLFSSSRSVSFVLVFETILGKTKPINNEFADMESFDSDEIVFSEFHFPSESYHQTLIHKQGSIVIEGVFPNPNNPQNEWIYICNRSDHSEDLSLYSIEDENSSDGIVSYQTRFPNQSPVFSGSSHPDFTSSILAPNVCAWIVDPEGENWYFPPIVRNTDKLLTVVSTSTIGNGIAAQEKLDLYKMKNGIRVHSASYGKKTTLSPFSVKTGTDEYSLLVQGKIGNSSGDFQIFQVQH